MTTSLAKQLRDIPKQPGVYLYYDRQGVVIYVGKAKNLAKRVKSYFQRTKDLTAEKQILVRSIHRIETIVTSSEIEALLLEATLIKRHQPKHNIVLRDDKYFLYVRIPLDDPYPPVVLVRSLKRDRARYFGPYTSAYKLRSTLKLLRKIFPYRICPNPPETPCFDAQLGRCAGHDLGPDSRAHYQEIIQGVMRFLSGHSTELLKQLKKEMQLASRSHDFERAAEFRDRLQAAETVVAEQKVVSAARENEDYVGFARSGSLVLVNLFRVRQGKLIGSEQFRLSHAAQASEGETLAAFLEQYYAQSADHPRQVLLPLLPDGIQEITNALQLPFVMPQRGKKKKLLQLAAENAKLHLDQDAKTELKERDRRTKALKDLAQALGLANAPRRIEAYDISNIQGRNPVASMVVVEEGVPKKSEYRKFIIRHVKGPDDFHMLAETLGRRLQHPDWTKPDLIVLDGGKGQLSVVRALVPTKIPMVALAKREEEIFLPETSKPVMLPRDSEALYLMQRIRDEAHRFAIGFHRQRRGKEALRSRLDDVEGIGPKTKKLLKERYGTVAAIRSANFDDLVRLVGKAKASLLREML
ncbi:MAG: excinuclease ABC subunit UvrC [Candidatus Nomurabacteria bacterium]|nr:MAG: excinuclease ABC subunit UvrC [Candidatus Nomurabacteria bacterium]